MSIPRCVSDTKATLGEGPVWVQTEQAIYWVDIKSHHLHKHQLSDASNQLWTLPWQLTSLAPRDQGGFIGTLRNEFALFDAPFENAEIITSPETHLPNNRFNDGKVDNSGRYWAGSMDDNEQLNSGQLYCLEANSGLSVKDSNYVITNGPAFNKANTRLYHTDTVSKTIFAFDMDTNGSLSNKTKFITLDETLGYPDGMTVDAQDCLWVCHWGGWCISRFSAGGELIKRYPMPVANVTSCTFAGNQLDSLFITTARKDLTAQQLEDQPQAGGLFKLNTGICGLPSNTYPA